MKKLLLSKTKAIIVMSVSVFVAVLLIVANIVTSIYSGLITVHLSGGGTVSSEEGKQTGRQVVEEGIVLLKNEDDALPLADGEKKLALIGQNSVDFVYGGSGSGSVSTANAAVAPISVAFHQGVTSLVYASFDTPFMAALFATAYTTCSAASRSLVMTYGSSLYSAS